MHELGITQSIVEIVSAQAGEARVARVIVEVGRLSAVMPDAIRFCFELCCAGTVLEGAELEIIETPGRGRCRACGVEMPLNAPFGQCPCGSWDVACIAGEALMIKAMEMA